MDSGGPEELCIKWDPDLCTGRCTSAGGISDAACCCQYFSNLLCLLQPLYPVSCLPQWAVLWQCWAPLLANASMITVSRSHGPPTLHHTLLMMTWHCSKTPDVITRTFVVYFFYFSCFLCGSVSCDFLLIVCNVFIREICHYTSVIHPIGYWRQYVFWLSVCLCEHAGPCRGIPWPACH